MSNQLNLTSLSIYDLVKLLRKSGSGRVSEEKIKESINAGAPVNPDGTINMINYAAFMLKETDNGN